MEIPDFIEDIIEKTLRGQEDALERERLDKWLGESPAHERLYREFVRGWDLGRFSLKWNGVAVGEAWERVSRRRWVRRWRVLIPVAASLAVLVGIYFLLNVASPDGRNAPAAVISPGESKAVLTLSDGRQVLLNKEKEAGRIDDAGARIHHASGELTYVAGEARSEELFHEIAIPVGGEFHLTLSDGTSVYLNAASRLRFPAYFLPGAPREVTLEGEGYFDVVRDTASPFIVHARAFDARVLGTSFNMMVYEGDVRSALTLEEGEVIAIAGGEEWRLEPSQQLVMDERTGEWAVRQVAKVAAYVNWKNGILDFDAMPLEELTARLGRWYDVEFFFADDRLRELLFTGSVRKYENINYILGLIGSTTDVAFEINERVVTVCEKSRGMTTVN